MSEKANKRINKIIEQRLDLTGRKPSQLPEHMETDWEFLRRLQRQVNVILPVEGPQEIGDVDEQSKRIVLQHQANCLAKNLVWAIKWGCVLAGVVIIANWIFPFLG